MTDDIRAAVLAELLDVAPDLEDEDLEDSAHLRRDLDLDSMDFLAVVGALSKRFGVPVPEADYKVLGTVAEVVAYLAERRG
jgi:acyl carrier protein